MIALFSPSSSSSSSLGSTRQSQVPLTCMTSSTGRQALIVWAAQRMAPSPDRVGSTAHGSAGSAPPARPEMVGRSKPGTSTPSTNSRQGLEAPVCRRLCSSDGPRLTRHHHHHHHHHHRQRQVSRPLGIGDSGPRDEETARSVSFLYALIDLGIQIQTYLTSVDEDITSDHHHHHHGVYGTIGPPVPSNPYTRTKSLGFTKKTQP